MHFQSRFWNLKWKDIIQKRILEIPYSQGDAGILLFFSFLGFVVTFLTNLWTFWENLEN